MSEHSATTRRPPGPRGYPLVGVLPRIWRDPLRFFEQVAHEQGPIACVGVGRFTLYLLNHPDAIQHVLQDNGLNYWKGAGIEMVKPVMGEGLAVVEGDAWKRQRRMLQPYFQRRRLREFLPAMGQAVAQALSGWEARARASAPVDVAEEASALAQRIVVRTLFGGDLQPGAGTRSEALVVANQYVNTIVWSLLPEWLPSPRRRRFRKAMALLDETVFQIIERRRASGSEGPDLLGRLLEARDPEGGEGLTDRQLRDTVMTLFVAGHDTTASATAWCLALLAQHPEARARVRAEAQALPEAPSIEELDGMDYTGRVLQESMRLYPPAWLMVRTPYADDEVLGYPVAKDSPLLFSQWVIHRHPDLWEAPLTFDPDRFLPERTQGRHRYAYFPFGGGRRLCIGNILAELMIKLVVAAVLRRYDFELVPGHPLVPQPLTTLRPKHGVRVRLRALAAR